MKGLTFAWGLCRLYQAQSISSSLRLLKMQSIFCGVNNEYLVGEEMKCGCLSVLAFICCTSGASADGLNDWNGFYLGGGLSFSSAESKVSGNRFTFNQNRAVNLVEHGFEGVGVRGFAGWNTRRRNWVFGGELELSSDSLESNLVFNADNDIDQVEINWSGALVGRLGFVSNETLFYAKGGFAFAKLKVWAATSTAALSRCPMHTLETIFSPAQQPPLAWNVTSQTDGLRVSN